MKHSQLLFQLSALLLSYCFPKVNITESGGVRFDNPSTYWLKYKRQKFNNGQRIKIDTKNVYETTIYGQDSCHSKMIARFFPNGQVLFFVDGHSTITLDKQVNDSLAGIPGYYAVVGDKLKFQRWTSIFGDRTPDTYGIILNDSTLKIYETYVPDCKCLFDGMSKYECLEQKDDYSIWKKTNKYKLEPYTPTW